MESRLSENNTDYQNNDAQDMKGAVQHPTADAVGSDERSFLV
jgi:hypothetical protein